MVGLINKVAEIYNWLDSQIAIKPQDKKGLCSACGKCCDFDKFDHRLFVTEPERMFFKAKADSSLKQMRNGICPYNNKGKCSVYDIRFAGCRIFACGSLRAHRSVKRYDSVHPIASANLS